MGQAPAGDLLQLWSGALHPFHEQLCATAGGNGIQLWDMRSLTCTGEQVLEVYFIPEHTSVGMVTEGTCLES